MRKFSTISLNNLQNVHPDLVRVVSAALQSSPIDFKVIEGRRTIERQRALFAAGRSKTMNSRHIHGMAVDLWPIDPITGKAAISGDDTADRIQKRKLDDRLHELFDLLGPALKNAAKAEGVPLEWGGDWTTLVDKPHFQLPAGLYPDGSKWGTPAPAPERRSPSVILGDIKALMLELEKSL